MQWSATLPPAKQDAGWHPQAVSKHSPNKKQENQMEQKSTHVHREAGNHHKQLDSNTTIMMDSLRRKSCMFSFIRCSAAFTAAGPRQRRTLFCKMDLRMVGGKSGKLARRGRDRTSRKKSQKQMKSVQEKRLSAMGVSFSPALGESVLSSQPSRALGPGGE